MARRKTALMGVSASTRITKVAIYIRVSTIHQVDKDSIPMQKKDLIAYCQLILGTDNYEILKMLVTQEKTLIVQLSKI